MISRDKIKASCPQFRKTYKHQNWHSGNIGCGAPTYQVICSVDDVAHEVIRPIKNVASSLSQNWWLPNPHGSMFRGLTITKYYYHLITGSRRKCKIQMKIQIFLLQLLGIPNLRGWRHNAKRDVTKSCRVRQKDLLFINSFTMDQYTNKLQVVWFFAIMLIKDDFYSVILESFLLLFSHRILIFTKLLF